MCRTMSSVLCLMLLISFLNTAAFAQEAAPPNSPPADHMMMPGGDMEDRLERRKFREERQQLRSEHEALEAEHDKVKVECMNAKGQDRTSCEDKKHAMHEKMEDLHVRLKALHEKEMSEHQQHHPGSVPHAAAAPAMAPQ